jgi:type II secretory pathway pseudopilin PulG
LAESNFSKSQAGFSLVEVMVATGLLTASLLAVAQLFAISVSNNTAARDKTFATLLADQKMEQLRALTWGFDALGLPLSDTTANLAVDPQTPIGGPGLSPSPATALRENTPGYVDYVNQFGRVIGGNTCTSAAGRWNRCRRTRTTR